MKLSPAQQRFLKALADSPDGTTQPPGGQRDSGPQAAAWFRTAESLIKLGLVVVDRWKHGGYYARRAEPMPVPVSGSYYIVPIQETRPIKRVVQMYVIAIRAIDEHDDPGMWQVRSVFQPADYYEVRACDMAPESAELRASREAYEQRQREWAESDRKLKGGTS